MTHDSAHVSDGDSAGASRWDFRRDERLAILLGGASLGTITGVTSALALGRTDSWTPLVVAAPVFAIAAYLAVATFRDAMDRHVLGYSAAAGLVALCLLAWPAAALIFPVSAPGFWVAPLMALGSMVLVASGWVGAQRATYRLSCEAAALCAIVGFFGLTQLMS